MRAAVLPCMLPFACRDPLHATYSFMACMRPCTWRDCMSGSPYIPYVLIFSSQDPVIFNHRPLDASTNITFYGLVGAPEWWVHLSGGHT